METQSSLCIKLDGTATQLDGKPSEDFFEGVPRAQGSEGDTFDGEVST